MAIYSIEVRQKGEKKSWYENLSLKVPTLVNSARKLEKIQFDDPIDAAFATMEFFNSTLRANEKPREVISVFNENERGEKAILWEGIYPCYLDKPE